MNFPVIEMFHSIQGEGKYMGVPTFFVRVSGCNLRCVFKNSTCDTPYSSFDPEKSPYKTVDDIVDVFIEMYKQNPKTKHICITGGEPMLYQKGIDEFLTKVTNKSKNDFIVTIETNGSLDPSYILEKQNSKDTNYNINLLSVSPKLSTSVDKVGKISDKLREQHNKNRINIENLSKYIEYDEFNYLDTCYGEVQLKFVYSGEECIQEIEDLLEKICSETGYTIDYLNDLVYLMPEGATISQMNNKECVEKCIEKSWKYAPRLHIFIWGDKRGV